MWPLSAILFSVTGDNCWLVCMSQSVNHFYFFSLIDFFLSYQSRIIEENAISSSSFITSSLNVSVKDNPVVSKFTDKGVLVCTETHTCLEKLLCSSIRTFWNDCGSLDRVISVHQTTSVVQGTHVPHCQQLWCAQPRSWSDKTIHVHTQKNGFAPFTKCLAANVSLTFHVEQFLSSRENWWIICFFPQLFRPSGMKLQQAQGASYKRCIREENTTWLSGQWIKKPFHRLWESVSQSWFHF